MDFTMLLVAGVCFVAIYLWLRSRDTNLPPFPTMPLPIFGHYYHLVTDHRPIFKRWKEKCGDMYSLYLGGTYVLVLNGYDIIKEVLVKKADFFSDRPKFFFDQATGMHDTGIIFSSGPKWKEQRTVSINILRSFGMGKRLLSDKVEDEVHCYLKYMTSLNGKPTDLREMLTVSTSNIMLSILIGHRFEYEDAGFKLLIKQLGVLAIDQGTVSLINFFFWLKYIPGDYFKAKKLVISFNAVMNSLAHFIDEKKKHIGQPGEVCDLIDAYLIEKTKKMQAGEDTFMDDRNLVRIMMDLLQGGTETSSITVCWVILYMLHHPDVQEKVYQEIKAKIGTDRTPTMQDKNQLTYLNAVIHETQRLASIVPLSVTKICTEEVTLRGYTVPKGAYILTDLDSVLHDKTTWGADAMSFRPERFIDDNGKLKIPEQFIPFGIGRRVCLGESLAKVELFLYLSYMFQRFQFLPLNPSSVPPLEYECGLVAVPMPYQVRAVERK